MKIVLTSNDEMKIISCPECKFDHEITIGEIRKSPTIKCGCGKNLVLHAEEFDQGLKILEEAVADTNEKLVKLSRSMDKLKAKL